MKRINKASRLVKLQSLSQKRSTGRGIARMVGKPLRFEPAIGAFGRTHADLIGKVMRVRDLRRAGS